jgi:hypothetical protein
MEAAKQHQLLLSLQRRRKITYLLVLWQHMLLAIGTTINFLATTGFEFDTLIVSFSSVGCVIKSCVVASGEGSNRWYCIVCAVCAVKLHSLLGLCVCS